MECIKYKKGFKYQLTENYSVKIPIYPDKDIETYYISLTRKGKITVKRSYSWDGPSGPTIDTETFMRASLVHDALYQLMRMGLLDKNRNRDRADRLLQKMCVEDKMSSFRAWYVYRTLHMAGDPAADARNQKRVHLAPKSC